MDGVVGGCRTTSAPGGDVTDWYCAPNTMDDVTAACEGEGEGEVAEP
jgi:hypothetical protein